MNRFLIWPIILCGVLGMLAGQGPIFSDDPESLAKAFLKELYTITRRDIEQEIDLDVPSMDYEVYLEAHFGKYCTEEMLQGLLSSRYPFQEMKIAKQSGYDIVVDQIDLASIYRADEANTGFSYTVFAHVVCSDGSDGEAIEYTGRLTLRDTERGIRVISMTLGHL